MEVPQFQTVLTQTAEASHCFARSLPVALVATSLAVTTMRPSKENGMFFGGSVLAFIVGTLFIGDDGATSVPSSKYPRAFLPNNVSFYGIALGYFAGYILMISFHEHKIGNVVASFLIMLILALLVSWSLYHDQPQEILLEFGRTMGGVCLGGLIGILFAHFTHRITQNKEEDTEMVCRTYKDGLLIHEERTD